MVRGLLMLSVLTSDVSSDPGRDVMNSCLKKLFGLLSPCQLKMRSTQKNCAPTVDDRFLHSGFSGSTGGRSGSGPTWQKPHDMPMRYGFTRSRWK